MKSPSPSLFKPARAQAWTLERIALLSADDIKQLRENAQRLNETEVVALCSEALALASPHGRSREGRKSGTRTRARRLIGRAKAFEAQGVWLRDPRTSWGGARKADGAVVLAMWADAIESADGGCCYLLWAPNVDGSRPWSDAPAGQERLEHCRQAMAHGGAQGLLVYGERLNGYIPEDRAYAVHGADPEIVVQFQVEMRGGEFWAKWGKRVASAEGS
jgi:hypothetical protein